LALPEMTSILLAVRGSSHPLINRQVGGKNDGQLIINILLIVSGKQIESMADCSLMMLRARRVSCDVVKWSKSKMQKHSNLNDNV